MNTQRILTWAGFVIVIGLIIWGMVAASKKADKISASIAPVDEITSGDWINGASSSQITLIEYSDFQCPACYAYFPVIEKLMKEEAGKVKLVYRHFPLPQHANAVPAAKASEAAGKQGKFWEMYEMIFSTHDEWENSTDIKTVFDGYAVKLGLDMEKYNADFISKETTDAVNADINSGLKAGINSTPTFYLNGKKITNPQGYEEFKKLIDSSASTTQAS